MSASVTRAVERVGTLRRTELSNCCSFPPDTFRKKADEEQVRDSIYYYRGPKAAKQRASPLFNLYSTSIHLHRFARMSASPVQRATAHIST